MATKRKSALRCRFVRGTKARKARRDYYRWESAFERAFSAIISNDPHADLDEAVALANKITDRYNAECLKREPEGMM